MLDADLDKILLDLIKQWNIAERRIKKAEHVKGEEVVISAIFELRYAGRKIIDAIDLALNGDLTKDAKRYGDIRSQLDDAVEDCVKAKHDAIDAMLSFVTIWFDKIEKELGGVDALTALFPDYVDQTSRISMIQEKIAQSRENRRAGRDGIYDEIEASGFDDILSLYERMSGSKKRIEETVRRQRRNKAFEFWTIVVGSTAAVLLLMLESYRYWTGH